MLSTGLREHLVCPLCRDTLGICEPDSGRCDKCDTVYWSAGSAQPDFRLARPIEVTHTSTLGTGLPAGQLEFLPLQQRQGATVDFSGMQVPFHFTPELLSHIPRADANDNLLLDVGCGDAIHRGIAERAGYEYVGLDYMNEEAPMLGDAHRLPFRDNTFDFIISIAVFEHIQFPFIAMQEIFRVMKPGAQFLGTVAFLEPFHGDSYYHHTHLGTLNSLNEGGFDVQLISPNERWNVLAAQAAMGLFPRMPEWLAKVVMAPVQLTHRMWWWLGALLGRNAAEDERVRITTGSFAFLARKPG